MITITETDGQVIIKNEHGTILKIEDHGRFGVVITNQSTPHTSMEKSKSDRNKIRIGTADPHSLWDEF